jgi:hypothetical protein
VLGFEMGILKEKSQDLKGVFLMIALGLETSVHALNPFKELYLYCSRRYGWRGGTVASG